MNQWPYPTPAQRKRRAFHYLRALKKGETLASLGAKEGITRQGIHLAIVSVPGYRELLAAAVKKGRAIRKAAFLIANPPPEPAAHQCTRCGETFYRVPHKYRPYQTCSKWCHYQITGESRGIVYNKLDGETVRALRLEGKTWREIVEAHGYAGMNAIIAAVNRVKRYERAHLPKRQWIVGTKKGRRLSRDKPK